MDRGTWATLSTYSNPTNLDGHSRISQSYQVDAFQRRSQLRVCDEHAMQIASGHPSQHDRENLRYSMGPRLEAFSCNPTDGSLAVVLNHLAAFAKCLSELFLSY